MLLFARLGWAPAVGLRVVGVIVNAGGRSLQTPALSSLISRHSDPRQQGAVFGLFHMLGSLARVIGPIIAGGVYSRHHTAPFMIAGGVTLVAAAWAIVLRSNLGATRDAAHTPAEAVVEA